MGTKSQLSIRGRLGLVARIAKYHARILLYNLVANGKYRTAVLPENEQPSVTLFISSFNTRDALKLTLSSLGKNTKYKNYKIIVAENASTDGSKEFLASLNDDKIVVINAEPRAHGLWLDQMLREADTKYWFAVDSDILFLAPDWLSDMVRVFESNPNAYMLSGEPKPGGILVEPFGNQTVEAGDCPSTWLFGIRSALREFVDTSFVYGQDGISEASGYLMTFDTGGKLLRDMRKKSLDFVVMPESFRRKWYHFGSLSWISSIADDPAVLAFKRHQQNDIKRRVRKYT